MAEGHPQEQSIDAPRLRLNYRSAEEIPVYFANQFLLQFVDDGYVLSFGQATPPAILEPTPEEIESIQEIPVRVLGRISMTPERTRALMLLLQRQLERFSGEINQEALTEDVME